MPLSLSTFLKINPQMTSQSYPSSSFPSASLHVSTVWKRTPSLACASLECGSEMAIFISGPWQMSHQGVSGGVYKLFTVPLDILHIEMWNHFSRGAHAETRPWLSCQSSLSAHFGSSYILDYEITSLIKVELQWWGHSRGRVQCTPSWIHVEPLLV